MSASYLADHYCDSCISPRHHSLLSTPSTTLGDHPSRHGGEREVRGRKATLRLCNLPYSSSNRRSISPTEYGLQFAPCAPAAETVILPPIRRVPGLRSRVRDRVRITRYLDRRHFAQRRSPLGCGLGSHTASRAVCRVWCRRGVPLTLPCRAPGEIRLGR
ncbi:hypothetical protein EJ06DRAFT_44245 [Trichodelitschia bisporula]|uniref:Uncharacterized protein n=1 Tax=Trichodelitschia bisporula TaxID=703511 RepID=A0A6G1HVT4_9PEZI|nr:hypothetical protein EJ06DRAFT_44245 [Trichodelitschia bisporula]